LLIWLERVKIIIVIAYAIRSGYDKIGEGIVRAELGFTISSSSFLCHSLETILSGSIFMEFFVDIRDSLFPISSSAPA
jgi:hypothetical protein